MPVQPVILRPDAEIRVRLTSRMYAPVHVSIQRRIFYTAAVVTIYVKLRMLLTPAVTHNVHISVMKVLQIMVRNAVQMSVMAQLHLTAQMNAILVVMINI